MLNNLKDLDLDLTTCFEKPELHHKVLQTLSNCAFRLESYSGYVGSDGEFVRFLKRQPGIESLGIKDAVLDFPDQSFPQDVLPRLKFLQTDYDFFLSIVRHPRMITHLDLSSWPMDDHEVDNILQVVGGQLVSFKYAKDSDPEFPVGQPSHVLRGGALPRLKFLDVGDFMENGHKSCFDLQADLEYMTDPTVSLERLVWSTVWETYPHRDGAFDELNGRLAFARIWADRVLRARRSLREIYYIERDLIYNEAFETGVLFTLSADGTLLQQDRKEQEIPVWSDV
ncbi:hypothetical protein EVJ58_g4361 [Rhodofomes roseus]|uniref:Uncharacterized protein n=1 Tax=Rhodofomes roseus TaxID=34475 RepID=A0A4Y9YI55_9APHY|nr:hypothetical protein EVJ58_g4361 [Rhodofomes roseus]